MSPSHHVAVLGGGLTGLSAAYHLARRHPDISVTVYEKASRCGGWVKSERVDVEDELGNTASVLLEAAPRTLRPNAPSVLEMINLLDLRASVLMTPKSSPAARARFLSLPDADGLSMLPSSLWSLFTTRLGLLILRAIVKEVFTPANRLPDVTDESVDSFFTRRFGADFARVLGSALVHGIYAADSRLLSVRAAFPTMWEAEERGAGSVIMGELGPRAWLSASRRSRDAKAKEDAEAWELGKDAAFEKRLKGAALISFGDGMETLIEGLLTSLRSMPNVVLQTECNITNLAREGSTFKLHTATEVYSHTHVASALPLPTLQAILAPELQLPHLTANPLQSVAVMNLVFSTSGASKSIHPPGFGFLIPRPPNGYPTTLTASNPGLLGVVFDTASLAAQDRFHSAGATPDKPSFIKLTAMIGGPYGVDSKQPPLLDAVLGQISSRLGTTIPHPVLTKLHVHIGGIPTYTVGHLERMREMREVAYQRSDGRLFVIGAGVAGVSVGDCIKAGRDVSRNIVF
ncbi:unnamed protein product [Peniophora sp. CBMAI 1063]|nr:unnamed protein product [Peniophora sp. CBMAI 1063]